MTLPICVLRDSFRSLFFAALLLAPKEAAEADEPIKPAEPPPGHSMHGEAFDEGPRQRAFLLGGTGRVAFRMTTTDATAQRFFLQGVGQLHGFWYWEAERSFRQAAAIDPDCAIAYWGMAMANVNNAERASKFIREAVKRKDNSSRRERLYIEALSEYYEDLARAKNEEGSPAQSTPAKTEEAAESPPSKSAEDAPKEKPGNSDEAKPAGSKAGEKTGDPKKEAEKKRKEAYLKKLEALAKEFPDDIEAKAFLAYYRWNWRDAVPIADHEAVDAILKQVFDVEPMHPAHHYRIHLWDEKAPERALASAALGGPAAPAIAHMWHMPGHIYSKLSRHADAVYQQEASARVDHEYMLTDGVMPYQIHNYAHNNEWLVRSLMHTGRVRDAVSVAKNLIETPRHPKLNSPANGTSAASFGRKHLIEAIALYELWSEYITLADSPYLAPGESEKEQDKHIRWLAAAHLASGNQVQGSAQLALLEERLAKLKVDQDDAGRKAEEKAREEKKDDAAVTKARERARKGPGERTGRLEKGIAHLHGLQAAAIGDHKGAVEQFEKAGDLPKPHLARAFLRAGDKEKAEKLAREAVDSAKNQIYPLATLVEVLFELGKEDEAKQAEAKKAFEQLRALAAWSDLKAPIFDRLDDAAMALGHAGPWKLAAKEAEDLGPRPPIGSFGPLLWRPAPAVGWTLPDSEGRLASLSQYGGKPVVVIFYLGYGCLECAKQLKSFAPLAQQFNEAGIQLVAISTDSIEDLKRSIESAKNDSVDAKADGAEREATDRNQAPPVSAAPIKLLSNSDLRTFKAYRAYDDFEQRPLHGTFLIDGDGFVRWQEIGATPFADAAFLLEEAKRVMALPR